ncbi:duplicated orphan permease [Chitinophaga jiangningensis]|uniref:Duplicated orphan permease n=1 Tax=Chitinophaga jiangningensis TaxID=1419482 RepID=A0A1M7CXG5_9BACT|nr:ABC transporter permease [Chitinophaga jiangningensis]SHL72018.1 duplicated orphan permease [Chitinophaga jiangningensis]
MLKNYFKIAWRNLLKNKTYGLLNVLGLSLSIGAAILIITMVKFHLAFDTFHHNADRIYRIVTEQHRDKISYTSSTPPPLSSALRRDYSYTENIARVVDADAALITIPQGKEVKKFKEDHLYFAEPDYLQIFNFPLVAGSAMLGEPNTAVITKRTARKYFGNTDPVNKTFSYNNLANIRITGVLKDIPAESDQQPELILSWPTVKLYDSFFSSEDTWGGITSDLSTFIRLRPGVSTAEVERQLADYVPRYRPKSKNVHHYLLQPLSDVHYNARYGGSMERKNLLILSLIAVFLLFTACVNFINLATAQAVSRSKEVGIRKALGGQRRSLFWQFIAETAVITLTATLIAILISWLLLPTVNNYFHTNISYILFSDPKMAGILALVVVLVTFLAGAYPGLILSGFKPVAALKGKVSPAQLGGFNTRRSLITAQFTISLILIIVMLVINRQMQYTQQFNLGFNKDAVVMVPMGSDQPDISRKTLAHQLENITGVEHVTMCFTPPSTSTAWNTNIYFDNREESELFRVNIKAVDENYLPTFGLRLTAGRNLLRADSAREMLINETAVRKLGLASPEEALNKVISFDGGQYKLTVVGIVSDFHNGSLHREIEPVGMAIMPDHYQQYAIKTNMTGLPTTLAAIEKAWTAMYPEKIYEYHFLDDSIAEFYETEQAMLRIVKIFSLISIFIACLGLYGLVSFMVVQKRKEIGIRKVLGGSIGGILWLFGKEFARLILLAFMVAGPLGWWLMNSWLKDFRYHITLGPGVFLVAIAGTMIIAALTVGVQSARAAMMNPIRSLKSE